MGKEINVLLCVHGVLNILAALPSAGIAQLVEQRIRNAWVGCSSHPAGTIYFNEGGRSLQPGSRLDGA